MGGTEQHFLQRATHLGAHASSSRKRRVKGRHPPVESSRWRFDGTGERRADHHRVRATGESLGDIATLAHATVGDDVDVDTRLVEVTHARTRDVGNRRRLGHANAEHRARRARVTWTDPDEDARRARAHEVQRRLITRAATHDDGQLEVADELLEIERLDGLGHVLGGDDRPLNNQDVESRVEDGLRHPLGSCGRHRRRRGDSRRLHLLDALGDEF